MIDDLQYWQRVLANAERHKEIIVAQERDDLRERKACDAAIEEAKNKVNELS